MSKSQMSPKNNQPMFIWKAIPALTHQENGHGHGAVAGFACVSIPEKKRVSATIELTPTATAEQLLKHPLAVVALMPKGVAHFAACALSGAACKTVTAPLDLIKIIMQTHGMRAGQEKTIGFLEALVSVGKQEGVTGYWKGNLAQVLRIAPYSAVQLFAFRSYRKLLYKEKDSKISTIRRFAVAASAVMTATLVTYPFDVLRLRMAVDPGHDTIRNVVVKMLQEEGVGSFYKGLVPALIGIAPYIAVNYCVYGLIKKSLPEKYRNRREASLITAYAAATIATLTCYPLDTLRRQMQMRGTPYKTVLDAFLGVIAQDGVAGLYRGFLPSSLKTLPGNRTRDTSFEAMERLIGASEKELQRIMEENIVINNSEEKQRRV